MQFCNHHAHACMPAHMAQSPMRPGFLFIGCIHSTCVFNWPWQLALYKLCQEVPPTSSFLKWKEGRRDGTDMQISHDTSEPPLVDPPSHDNPTQHFQAFLTCSTTPWGGVPQRNPHLSGLLSLRFPLGLYSVSVAALLLVDSWPPPQLIAYEVNYSKVCVY